jgi:asparagine synthetase B (glutamine-hydrolysing)
MSETFSVDSPDTDGSHPAICSGADLSISSEGHVLSRSTTSSEPVFYYMDGDDLVTSTSMLELIGSLKERKARLEYDEVYMAGYLVFQAPLTHRTLFSEINVLRGGETCYINPSGQITRYLPFDNCETPRPITSREFARGLDNAIKKLNPDKTVFHISSGLDSSIIAIRAARIFGGQRVHLATCRTRGAGCTDELVNIQKLADEIKADLCIYDLTDTDVFTAGRELVTNCLGYPIAHPSHLVEFLLDANIAATDANIIVTGKGPDECLAGYTWHRSEYSVPSAHCNRKMVTSKIDLSRVMKNADCDEMMRFWRERPDTLSLNERLRYDEYTLTEAWNIIHSAVARYHGVEIISPFMEKELRQGMFSLPEDMKLKGDRQKVFLRETFGSEYPDYILGFPKRGLRLDLSPYFREYDERELWCIVGGNSEKVDRYFKAEGIRDMIRMTCRVEKNYGWQLWSLYLLTIAASSDGLRGNNG